MLNSTEKKLNLFWLLILAWPPAGGVYKVIANAENWNHIALGMLSAGILFWALFIYVPQFRTVLPEKFFKKSFPLLFLSYIPSIAGYWEGGLSLTALIWPLMVYLFFSANDRLTLWAHERVKKGQG